MQQGLLGGLMVSRIGLGCVSMSDIYTGAGSDDAEAIRAIHTAPNAGVTFLDTAEVYGPFLNEELIGHAVAGRRHEYVIATKFGAQQPLRRRLRRPHWRERSG